jgi:hypothetical protein
MITLAPVRFPIPPAVTDDTAPRDIRCGAKRAPREPKATVAQVIAIIRAAHAEATA